MGICKWVIMLFDLKNVGTTYQIALNAIFHDMIGDLLDVYIDDVVEYQRPIKIM